jgi:hypothetical protein
VIVICGPLAGRGKEVDVGVFQNSGEVGPGVIVSTSTQGDAALALDCGWLSVAWFKRLAWSPGLLFAGAAGSAATRASSTGKSLTVPKDGAVSFRSTG